MKAISIYQPWATFIAHGHLSFLRSSWKTRHRGKIALHAHGSFADADIYNDDLVAQTLIACGYSQFENRFLRAEAIPTLPHGALIGTATLHDVVLFDEISPAQRKEYFQFGGLKPGKHVWILKNQRVLRKPIPTKGRPGLFATNPLSR